MDHMERTTGRCVIKTKAEGHSTEIDVLRQEGAFKAKRPISEPSMNGFMESILINTSGGLTGGDKMSFRFDAGENTKNTITTQAYEKYYKSLGDDCKVHNELRIEHGANLRWLPQETILFDRSHVRRSTHIHMAANSNLLFAETVILGRQAQNERYAEGKFSDSWRVMVGNKLVHRESISLQPGNVQQLQNKAILNGAAVYSTVMAVGELYLAQADRLRAAMAESDLIGGVSVWRVNGVAKLVIRLIAQNGYDMRKLLIPILTLLCRGAPPPRAWSI